MDDSSRRKKHQRKQSSPRRRRLFEDVSLDDTGEGLRFGPLFGDADDAPDAPPYETPPQPRPPRPTPTGRPAQQQRPPARQSPRRPTTRQQRGLMERSTYHDHNQPRRPRLFDEAGYADVDDDQAGYDYRRRVREMDDLDTGLHRVAYQDANVRIDWSLLGRLWSPAPLAGPSLPFPFNVLRRYWVIIAILSLIIIFQFGPGSGVTRISGWSSTNPLVRVAQTMGLIDPAPAPPGDYRLRAPPSVSASQINDILASYASPAAGTGAVWVEQGRQYGIDPAFAVAFFIHESSAGTNRNWAGLKPDGSTTHNVGNIICAGYPTCHGRFRDYPSWEAGIADWYRLIAVEYIDGRGTETVAEIIPIYAPAVENDVNGYVRAVENLVDEWRRANGIETSLFDGDLRPVGNPLNAANTVMTQGYGTGTHAPAHIWGAIDLAIDGDGDGVADPDGTQGQPIYATHPGVVTITPNSWPAGNHVWVANDAYRTGYAHLDRFAVTQGQRVDRGTLIGYVGSTGMSSGPHLDYQIWQQQEGQWVNQNPLAFSSLQNR